jgi:hypothetical protein
LKRTLYIVLFAAIAIASCKTGSNTTATGGALHPDSIFATLERQPCFGHCPAFYATIYNNGKAVYEGHSTVTKLGKWTGKLTADQMRQLSDKAIEFRLDTLGDDYINKNLVDFPGHSVSILMNGRLKKISVMETQIPQAILTYENFMEDILNQVEWKKEEPKKEE